MRKVIMVVLFTCLMGNLQAQSAYNFKLPDSHGKMVRLSDFKGKVVVLDFWFTGCINCMRFYKESLSTAEQRYKENHGAVFISICIDKDKATWLNSLEKGRYASKESINLYTGGLGAAHPVIKNYQVSSYPQPIVINSKGIIVSRSDHLTGPGELEKAIQTALK